MIKISGVIFLDFNQFLNQIQLTVLNVVIIPLLPVVTAFLIAYVKHKTSELENTIQKEELSKYLEIAENAIISSVAAVNQIYVDEIKDANGILSQVEQKNAFEMAKSKIFNIVGEAGISALNQLYKDCEAYLNNRIEYHVGLAKAVK